MVRSLCCKKLWVVDNRKRYDYVLQASIFMVRRNSSRLIEPKVKPQKAGFPSVCLRHYGAPTCTAQGPGQVCQENPDRQSRTPAHGPALHRPESDLKFPKAKLSKQKLSAIHHHLPKKPNPHLAAAIRRKHHLFSVAFLRLQLRI